MRLTVLRYSVCDNTTLGLLFIDGKFECYTLEDEPREVKVKGSTRIPSGTYEIKLRTEGGHHQRYSQKFPEFHKGMLHVQDVPNFTWILIHIGNTDDDTEGCLLVGDSAVSNKDDKGRINSSTIAYKRMYQKVAEALERGEQVDITYHDEIKLKNI